MIPPPTVLNPRDPDLVTRIAQIPNAQAVYLLTPATGAPYLGWTAYLSKRLTRLLGSSNPSNSFATLRNNLSTVEYWLSGSRLETSLFLYSLGRQHYPDTYRKRLKLRDPWLLSLLSWDPFPRIAVQSRIPKRTAATYGPFPTREAADRAGQGTLSLFQIRRCDETLRPAADHPGCIYGEMNHCLRPCQLAVSKDEYAGEAARVAEFLQTNGKHSLAVLGSARDRASEETDFEQAARLHSELERVKSVAALRDELVCNIDALNGVALTRAARESSVSLWPMVAGYWQTPLTLDFSPEANPARSLDRQLREQLREHLHAPRAAGDRAEEISLLARWYYSSWRDGQWFPFRTVDDLNYRKLVRGISALARNSSDLQSEFTPAVHPATLT